MSIETLNALGTDATLANGLAAGNPAAWGEFYRDYAGLAWAIARKCGLQDHDADDAAQNAMVAVLKGINTYDSGRPFRKWFNAVVRSVVLRLKHNNARVPTPMDPQQSENKVRAGGTGTERMNPLNYVIKNAEDLSVQYTAALDTALQAVRSRLARKGNGNVPREGRSFAIFCRLWINGESPSHVATEFNTTVGNVNVIKSRGMALLREEMSMAS